MKLLRLNLNKLFIALVFVLPLSFLFPQRFEKTNKYFDAKPDTLIVEQETIHLGNDEGNQGITFSKNFTISDSQYSHVKYATLNMDFIPDYGPFYEDPPILFINDEFIGSISPFFPPIGVGCWNYWDDGTHDYCGFMHVSINIPRTILKNGDNTFRIDNGASDDDYRFNNVTIVLFYTSILNPKEDNLWIAGEQDTIRWEGIEDDILLTIEYSTDSGSNWEETASGVSAGDRKYGWDIPKEILSTECFILLRDNATNDILAMSEQFKIKPYILTKIDPATENFIAYDINKDRWGFKNDSSDVWPDWWYDRFEDYTGNDPFTGKPYYEFTADSAFLESMGYEFPDWPSFVWAFSPSVCYIDMSKGIYSITAVKRWSRVSDDWHGSCFGIAGTNALAFMQRDRFTDKYQGFSNFRDPINVLSDSNVIPVVSEIFTHQFGKPSIDNDAVSINKTANETLREIKALLKKSDEVRTITIFNQNGKGGHTILSYKLEKDNSNGNIYYLYVYDNSKSGILDAKIRFDTTANSNTGSWEPLYGWPNWGGNKGIYLEIISDNYLDNAKLSKKCTMSRSEFILLDDKLEVLTDSENDIVITNGNNFKTGYSNGQMLKQIPNAYPMIIKNGSETPPYGYNLPNDGYSIETSNFTNPKTSTDIFTGNKIFTVSRDGALNIQKDEIHYWADQKIVLNNPAGETNKTFKLSEIINEITQEKMYIIRDVSMNENDSFEMMNTDTDKLKITNNGSEKNYSIELQYADENKFDRFLSVKVGLPFLSNHIISPNWADISNGELMILVDTGNNGTVDDTLKLENQVTGIREDQGSLIPNEYRLEQNFPNPFNSSTRISWQSPAGSHQTLKVYDILGNEVVTLVDEFREAGRYEVEFNPASSIQHPASGIYFYQLRAGDPESGTSFVETRKMILLK